jgi:hypothetical protein
MFEYFTVRFSMMPISFPGICTGLDYDTTRPTNKLRASKESTRSGTQSKS